MYDHDSRDYQAQFEQLLGVTLRPDGRGQAMTRCPFHDDRKSSLSLNVRRGLWFCHGGCGGGTFYGLAKRLGQSVPFTERRHQC